MKKEDIVIFILASILAFIVATAFFFIGKLAGKEEVCGQRGGVYFHGKCVKIEELK